MSVPHICVCICTYKRPDLLRRLLLELARQKTDGLFTYSALVAENDVSRSAEPVIAELTASTRLPLDYCVEPIQNIARARNKAVENASGDFFAFLDDDEFPTPTWLLTLFNTCAQYDADGVLGPVKPHFDRQPPAWVIRGAYYDRATYPTGTVIDWRKGRTGNVLFRQQVFAGQADPFNPEFLTGEDQEFFSRMIGLGRTFVWCNEAVAYEVVPPVRWTKSFILRRYWLRGAMEPKTPGFGIRATIKSALAIPLYVAVLPLLAIFSHSRLMVYSTKLSYHLGLLLALVGINPIKQPYVTA